ncbi:sigma-54-dependent transcriptional regulator [Desulfoplanes formicivorans]|uniref:Sigma-54-dependent Fis family transcriptional regulator n=1 Tax=Desulfoplanes formicivorans TaxID=1592317 RepID=A0A194ALV5_9BACT|nr:sigma-54 dependent transcriptional regulator [Desulfoplanes formicivorans]GAU09639.1 sigma-54-dependent Fis family transcriptional regulator [Desulfoplanes formicivorans]
MNPSILIVDDDFAHLTMLRTMLKGWGYDVDEAEDGSVAVDKVTSRPYDGVLMDVRMAHVGGIEALKEIMKFNPAIPVLIMTAYSSVETAVEALKAGAYDYLTKPLDFDELRLTLERAMDHTRLVSENRELRKMLPDKGTGMVGTSAPMKELMETIATVAPSDATILIQGESGTGKELVARAIHQNSRRKAKPLVTVNCAALTESLLESELFGHEKGAFTGADKRRDGRFVQAHKGTLFLDEIGEVAPGVQAKLLRALQEGEIQRVGSDKPIMVDVRVIAATNRNLLEEVRDKRFREDLYYRLNVISLAVPALRHRPEDIPLLAQFFLKRFMEKNHKRIRGFSSRLMDRMIRYDWPGNVRELENAVERAVIMSTGEFITERDMPLLASDASADQERPVDAGVDLAGHSLEEIERQAIMATIEATGGNKSEAARQLGITRATLHNKMKKYGV